MNNRHENCSDCIKLEGQQLSPDCCHNHKQETPEEAAEKEYSLLELTNHSSDEYVKEENLHLLGHRKSFIKGAKWQQERSYSEEEVWVLLNKLNETLNIGSDLTLEQWFKQSKK